MYETQYIIIMRYDEAAHSVHSARLLLETIIPYIIIIIIILTFIKKMLFVHVDIIRFIATIIPM